MIYIQARSQQNRCKFEASQSYIARPCLGRDRGKERKKRGEKEEEEKEGQDLYTRDKTQLKGQAHLAVI